MNRVIKVSKIGKIKTINEALSLINKNEKATIEIASGIYYEKLKITSSYITLKGVGIGKTIITYDDYSKKIHKDGRDYNTFRTPTLTIVGHDCKLLDLTIENAVDSNNHGQAVALAIYGDKFKAENVEIKGDQDTLFLGPLPDDLKDRYMDFLPRDELFIEGYLTSLFKKCIITGGVDFIFGNGVALFDKCDIVSIKEGYVTAPSHSLYQKHGFTFSECKFINKTPSFDNVYLVRFWRPFGKVNFLNCSYENHIKKEGVTPWNNKLPLIYSRVYEVPKSAGRATYVKELTSFQAERLITELDKILKY